MATITPLLLNNVSSTVQAGSSAIGSSSATGVNVASGDGANFGTIGTNQYIPAVIVDTSTSPETVKEYVYVTARSTDALTVVRQAEDSTRFPASTTTIQAGYTIAAVETRNGALGLSGLFGHTPRQHGWLTWNADPVALVTSVTLSKGVVRIARLPVPAKMTVNNLLLSVNSAGASLVNCFAGVYSADGSSLLASSADISGSIAGSSLLTAAMSSPPTVDGGPDVYVYGAILIGNGSTTNPSVYGSASAYLANAGVSSAYLSLTSGSGLSALPSTINPNAGSNGFLVWMGLS